MPEPRQQPTVRPWLPAVTEVFCALVVLAAAAGIIVNDLSAHLAFLGETAVITRSDVENYWTLVVALGTAVAGSLLAAAWRQRTLHRAGWAWGWHLLMAVAGAATALVFSVTTVGSVDQPRTDPAPTHTGPPPCYGTSGYCPGG